MKDMFISKQQIKLPKQIPYPARTITGSENMLVRLPICVSCIDMLLCVVDSYKLRERIGTGQGRSKERQLDGSVRDKAGRRKT